MLRLETTLRAICLALPASFLQAGGALSQDSDADLLAGIVVPSEKPAFTDVPAEDAGADAPERGLRWRTEISVTGHDRRQPNPAPPSTLSDSSIRLRFVGEGDVALGAFGSIRLNLAFNLFDENTATFDLESNARLHVREAYLLTQGENWTFELGRNNIRNGAALGYNPTDFFKTQAVEQNVNLNLAGIRDDRRGVGAVRVGHLWDSGAVSLTFAPRMTSGGSWLQDQDIFGLNFATSNPQDRYLLTLTQQVSEGMSPELFVFVDDGDPAVGVAVSTAIGNNWLVYGEATRGRSRNLVDAALASHRSAGALHPALVSAFSDQFGSLYVDRAAYGVSYASPSNFVVNLEHHYNAAGFDAADWREHFAVANTVKDIHSATRQLASIPRFAALTQEPMSEHSAFVRFVQNELYEDANLTGILLYDLIDGSSSGQLELSYNASERLTVSGRVGSTFGGRETYYGSRSSEGFIQFDLSYFF